jgi:hypothetical protein
MDVRERFERALNELVELVREDRHILAAILGGSLSHDQVWEKSDIDLVLIRTDEKKGEDRKALALTVDGVNNHTMIWSRDQFRKAIEGKTRNSFEHSFFAKARLLYTHDPTIEQSMADLGMIGDRHCVGIRLKRRDVNWATKAHTCWAIGDISCIIN